MFLNPLRENTQQSMEDLSPRWLHGGFGESLILKVKKNLGGQNGSQPAVAYGAPGAHELSLGMCMKQGGLEESVPA